MAHELLQFGVGFLGFVPIPGLEPAASTLLQIWDTLQQVDVKFLPFFLYFAHSPVLRQTNRLACLRMTERCADILLSIREEIHEAGNYVGSELHVPIVKLVECVHRPSLQPVAHNAPNSAFDHVHNLMHKQVNRPLVKQYLKRDDILQSIRGCDADLSGALNMFTVCPSISCSALP